MNDEGRLTYEVRVWAITAYKGKLRTTYRVRWAVAGKGRWKSFQTRKLAESYRSTLVTAATQGHAFDIASGLPESQARQANQVSWYQHALDFVAMKWPEASPKSRRSMAEALATVTPALMADGRGSPTAEELRRTLYGWSFNLSSRSEEPSTEAARVHAWMLNNSRPLAHLMEGGVTRSALDVLAVRLDGKQAARNTIARKRAVFYGALRYAVERDRLPAHPMDKVHWVTPKTDDEVDRRVVINPQQAAALLDQVRKIDPAMVAFYGCIYYAGLRPAEVLHLREADCALPQTGWGELLLTGATQYVGSWGDGADSREDRGLKHRARNATRPVPACPQLVELLRRHLDEFRPDREGRLFVTRTGPDRVPLSGGFGGPVSEASYGNTWRRARAGALTPAQVSSPLGRRPYDLRHACVSLWLNAGVPATTVAEWAGHSVAVLLRVYAKCVDGESEAAKRRVNAALNLHATFTQLAVDDRIEPDTAGRRP